MRQFFSVYMTQDAVGGAPADAGQDEGSASRAALVLPNPEQCELHRLAEVLLDRDRQRPRSESHSKSRSEASSKVEGRFTRMFANELSQPVRLLFDSPEIPEANDFRNLAESYGLIGKRLGELLHHPRPPVKLLEIAKRFARARRERREDPLPTEVATVLYFAWIAVALVRCRRRITGLGDEQVLEGIRWSLDQSWVDRKTCELLHAALSCIETASPVHE